MKEKIVAWKIIATTIDSKGKRKEINITQQFGTDKRITTIIEQKIDQIYLSPRNWALAKEMMK